MDNVLKTGMPDHEVVYVIIKLNVLEFENVHLSINDCMRIFFYFYHIFVMQFQFSHKIKQCFQPTIEKKQSFVAQIKVSFYVFYHCKLRYCVLFYIIVMIIFFRRFD